MSFRPIAGKIAIEMKLVILGHRVHVRGEMNFASVRGTYFGGVYVYIYMYIYVCVARAPPHPVRRCRKLRALPDLVRSETSSMTEARAIVSDRCPVSLSTIFFLLSILFFHSRERLSRAAPG